MSISNSSLTSQSAAWQSIQLDLGSGVVDTLEVFECVGGSPGPSVLVVAGIHGDEYEGPVAVADVASWLPSALLSGKVRLIPVANPFAFRAGTRTSPMDGVNLARVFPGRESGTPTERLAYFLFQRFAAECDYLIDLHSGGVEYEFLPVAGFYGETIDGNESFQAANAMRLPNLWQLPETAGVLSHEVSRAGGVAVGAEYGGSGRLSEEGARAYSEGVRGCLELWKLLQPSDSLLSPSPRAFRNDWLLSPATGVFRSHQALGDKALRGALLASILGPRGELLAQVTAPDEGVVLGLRSKAFINEGNWAVLLGQELLRHSVG